MQQLAFTLTVTILDVGLPSLSSPVLLLPWCRPAMQVLGEQQQPVLAEQLFHWMRVKGRANEFRCGMSQAGRAAGAVLAINHATVSRRWTHVWLPSIAAGLERPVHPLSACAAAAHQALPPHPTPPMQLCQAV